MIRLTEAIELHNLRNPGNKLTAQVIGFMIYPDSNYDTVKVSMNKITKGTMKKVNPEWVVIMAKATGTDPNFLFGFKSKHDKDYERFKPTTGA